MEKINVKDVICENKKNTEVFGVFMSGCINAGRSLRQFLADELQEGRVPLRGEESSYDPIKERVIIMVPREWGADSPDELVGAAVRFHMIGTIPVSDDNGTIDIVRLTEPTPDSKPDVVFDDHWLVENAALFGIGCNIWVRLVPPPMNLGDDPDESAPDDDDEGYW